MKTFIAIDIGGTDIKFAVLNHAAEIIYHDSTKTPIGSSHSRIKDEIHHIITFLLAKFNPINGVGISTAGVVDTVSGEILFAGETIPQYKGTNLKKSIEFEFGLPTIVANDVNAAALGEKWKGAATNSDDFFCITLGTGVGGAFYCNGKLVLGKHFRAGEIGYSLFDKSSGTTYEQRASVSALLKKAQAALPDFKGTTYDLFAKAKKGSNQCNEIINEWSEEIARGLAEIIVMVDPEQIIIGGGVSEQKEFLLSKIKLHLTSYLPENFSKTELRSAKLGNKAGLFGAVFPFYK